MNEGPRYRELIERTASILSSDLNRDEIFGRFGSSLFEAFAVSVTLIWLNAPGRPDHIEYYNDRGTVERPPRPRDVAAMLAPALESKRVTILRNVDFAGARIAALVPIRSGKVTYGVIGLFADDTEAFDAEDIRTLETIGRYLGIAMRNSRSDNRSRARRGSRLRTALPLALFFITLGLIGYEIDQARQVRDAVQITEEKRARNLAHDLDNVMHETRQLARTMARFLGGHRFSAAQVETFLRHSLASSREESVYGVGVWYLPYIFDKRKRYFGPYIHRQGDGRPPLLTYEWNDKAYDYVSRTWFIQGLLDADTPHFSEPYFDKDHVYVTAGTRFEDTNGDWKGVVTVDVIAPQLARIVTDFTTPGRDFAYLTQGKQGSFVFPNCNDFFTFMQNSGDPARLPINASPATVDAYVQHVLPDSTEIAAQPVALTDWTVHLAVRSSFLHEPVRALENRTILAIIGLWVAGAIGAFAIAEREKANQRSTQFQIEISDLEGEIGARQNAEEQLRRIAFYDTLTTLPNRASLFDALERALARARGADGLGFAVLYVDLDRFALVNDTLGHDIGDQLLCAVAQRLERILHANDLVARLGGDEFVVLLGRLTQPQDARYVAERIVEELTRSFTLAGHDIFIAASVGVALGDASYASPSDVLRDADIAMYRAKHASGSRVEFFEVAMRSQAMDALRIEADLRRAIDRREFRVAYQPIYALGGPLVGLEALVRWDHPSHGRVMPSDFIPIAERTGAVVAIGNFVLETVAQRIASWLRSDTFPSGGYVSVNIAPQQLSGAGFADEISALLRSHDLSPDTIALELTETSLMERAVHASESIVHLRELGILTRIDDFGTGYSSLAHLRRFSVTGLKIDRSFVADISTTNDALEIVRTIVALAKSLRLSVTAEGIETTEQLRALIALGVEFGQGFLFAQPIDALEMDDFLRSDAARTYAPRVET